MTEVRFPQMRREVINAIASVADRVYQERVWIRLEVPFDRYYDSLDEAVHWLFDDLEVLPNPTDPDCNVLLPGEEVERLKVLGPEFHAMIKRLGHVPDADYLADPAWREVTSLAAYCLPPMILAGGWEWTIADEETLACERAEERVPTVGLPATRRRVIKAVAALADSEYQQHSWTGGAVDPVTGSLDACLHTLTNDSGVLPYPDTAIGKVLVAGDEIDRLAILGSALGQIKDTSDVRESPRWPAVVVAALHCLPALVLAGAWIGPDQIPSAATGCHER